MHKLYIVYQTIEGKRIPHYAFEVEKEAKRKCWIAKHLFKFRKKYQREWSVSEVSVYHKTDWLYIQQSAETIFEKDVFIEHYSDIPLADYQYKLLVYWKEPFHVHLYKPTICFLLSFVISSMFAHAFRDYSLENILCTILSVSLLAVLAMEIIYLFIKEL